MEYSLTNDWNGSEHSDKCLNPYFNGILSDTIFSACSEHMAES